MIPKFEYVTTYILGGDSTFWGKDVWTQLPHSLRELLDVVWDGTVSRPGWAVSKQKQKQVEHWTICLAKIGTY